jgi:hypothetical protein
MRKRLKTGFRLQDECIWRKQIFTGAITESLGLGKIHFRLALEASRRWHLSHPIKADSKRHLDTQTCHGSQMNC